MVSVSIMSLMYGVEGIILLPKLRKVKISFTIPGVKMIKVNSVLAILTPKRSLFKLKISEAKISLR